MAHLDENKLHAFVGKMLGDFGGAFSVPTVRHGLKLGLFKALHERGPLTARELAGAAGGLTERYVREWALAQTANGYIDFDSASEKFSLSTEQAMVFVTKDSPVYLEGAFDLVAAMIEGEPKVEQSFRTGSGVRWGDTAGCLFCATGAFFRPGYVNNIVQSWLPALAGVEDKLKSGAKVADVGCGVGFSRLLMAKAYPNTHFIGYDFHEPSIEEARSHAEAHGLGDRVKFIATSAKEIEEDDFDLVTSFDCLHDMGDPRGCAGHMRRILKGDGTWMNLRFGQNRMLGTSAAPEGGTWIPALLNAMFESANRPSTKTPANGGQLWTFRVSRLFCHGLEPRSQKAHDEVATGFLS